MHFQQYATKQQYILVTEFFTQMIFSFHHLLALLINFLFHTSSAFSALTLLAGRQKQHQACKN